LLVGGRRTAHEVQAERIAADIVGPELPMEPQVHGAGRVLQRQPADDPPKPAPAFHPAPAPGATPPPPLPPSISRIDVRGAEIAGVPPILGLYHAFIVHYNSKTKAETFTRGGHTKDAPASVCPGVGRPKGNWLSLCPFDDPSYRAIGVGPVNAT